VGGDAPDERAQPKREAHGDREQQQRQGRHRDQDQQRQGKREERHHQDTETGARGPRAGDDVCHIGVRVGVHTYVTQEAAAV